MADIELVIKISEELYEDIKEHSLCGHSSDREIVSEAIANGRPLPKGYKRIVDIGKLIDSMCNECGHIRGVSCTVPCREVRRMLGEPTIIEADKENE